MSVSVTQIEGRGETYFENNKLVFSNGGGFIDGGGAEGRPFYNTTDLNIINGKDLFIREGNVINYKPTEYRFGNAPDDGITYTNTAITYKGDADVPIYSDGGTERSGSIFIGYETNDDFYIIGDSDTKRLEAYQVNASSFAATKIAETPLFLHYTPVNNETQGTTYIKRAYVGSDLQESPIMLIIGNMTKKT